MSLYLIVIASYRHFTRALSTCGNRSLLGETLRGSLTRAVDPQMKRRQNCRRDRCRRWGSTLRGHRRRVFGREVGWGDTTSVGASHYMFMEIHWRVEHDEAIGAREVHCQPKLIRVMKTDDDLKRDRHAALGVVVYRKTTDRGEMELVPPSVS